MSHPYRALRLVLALTLTAALAGCGGGLLRRPIDMGDVNDVVQAPFEPQEQPLSVRRERRHHDG